MDQTREEFLESEICEYLASHGWLYSPNDGGYDAERALFPEDLFGWLADTQREQLAKVVTAGGPAEQRQREGVLDAIAKKLDTDMASGGGTLNVLRRGAKHIAASFTLFQPKPPTTLNAKTNEDYAKTRVRVMRQVHYSKVKGEGNRAIDLVLFVNGIPVATAELKTEFKQSVGNAVTQYQQDRNPQGQPLLRFGRGALVHFAVSDDEVWMTTKLAGSKTFFLPFNLGNQGGAGNPPDPTGAATSYLWERVWQKDAWLNIFASLMTLVSTEEVEPISGAHTMRQTMLFPRFHQWDAVTSLIAAAAEEGPGHRYLIQHSAGSGKSNTIAWTAHRLARLHDAGNEKVFDKVIVITDRNVLDRQLRETVRQIDNKPGLVVAIDETEVRRSGSKSAALAEAMNSEALVVIVTIQTFPFAMTAIRDEPALKGRAYAIIADEAHSSQSGATAKELRWALAAGFEEIDEGDDADLEDVLLTEMEGRASAPNLSFFAFTATPKRKTLELFGRQDADGLPHPFHLYTMRQAIEEGFILDVLRGYQSYDTAFQLAQRVGASEGVPIDIDDGELVDSSTATKGLMRWVRLHPTNIGQKVQIIVEHFRANVARLLEGHAKAMVVTESRKAAVRYKVEIDKYIAEMGYDIGTLVAFSGSVDDDEYGIEKATEATMNPRAQSADLAAEFRKPEYRVMLVADKYQTGFDQPLLCAMYVDKRLDGITAVQTLSRLNRTYRSPNGENKDRTFVLDFRNEPEDIRKAFEPYFEEAQVEQTTDPNLIHQLVDKLDQADIYTDEDIDRFADAWYGAKGNLALSSAIAPAKNRFQTRYAEARDNGAELALAYLDEFRSNVDAYVRTYDFLSQIINYGDPRLEKLSVFLRQLAHVITGDRLFEPVDLSDVVIRNIKQIDRGASDIALTGGEALRGGNAIGTGGLRTDKEKVALAEVIRKLNELFGGEFLPDQIEALALVIARHLAEDPAVVRQVRNNTAEQFRESPSVDEALEDAAYEEGADLKNLAGKFTGGATARASRDAVKDFVYAFVKASLEYARNDAYTNESDDTGSNGRSPSDGVERGGAG